MNLPRQCLIEVVHESPGEVFLFQDNALLIMQIKDHGEGFLQEGAVHPWRKEPCQR